MMFAYPSHIDDLIEYDAVAEDAIPDRRDIQLFGNNLKYFRLLTPEKILYGPADTGKTITSLQWLHGMCLDIAGFNSMVCRAYYTDIVGSVFETYINKILPFRPDDDRCQVRIYGGINKPQKSIYPNGSVIHWVGLDKPGRALSTERDAILVNECNQIPQGTWNVLLSRCNGRAGNWIDENGNVQAMLMGDQNPGMPNDWVETRSTVEVVRSRHTDNPDLYDQETGEPTELGQRRLDTLARLTGPERDRLYLGKPVYASGLTYPAFGAHNVSDDVWFDPSTDYIVWGCDDGYTGKIDEMTGRYTADSHPRVFLIGAVNPQGVLKIVYEYHSVNTLVRDDVESVLGLDLSLITNSSKGEGETISRPYYAACENSKSLTLELQKLGIQTLKKPQRVEHSVKSLNDSLGVDSNGFTRIKINTQCVHLRYEMTVNQLKSNGHPEKENDHFLDALRYLDWRVRRN